VMRALWRSSELWRLPSPALVQHSPGFFLASLRPRGFAHGQGAASKLERRPIQVEAISRSDLAPLKFRAFDPALGVQASGAVLAQQGETVVQATCVIGPAMESPESFFPLTVEYRENASAAGKIVRTFTRREQPNRESDILAARAIDRSLRPLFPEGMQNELQIICTVWSFDGKHDPTIVAINAASAAVHLANIPGWNGPVGAARISAMSEPSAILQDVTSSEATILHINSASQDHHDASKAWLNLIVSGLGDKDKITMLEGSSRELAGETMMDAIAHVQPEIKASVQAQKDLIAFAQPPDAQVKILQPSVELRGLAESCVHDLVGALFSKPQRSKALRGKAQAAFWKVASERLTKACEKTKVPDSPTNLSFLQNIAIHDALRDGIARNICGHSGKESPMRMDGRFLSTIRDVKADVEVLPAVHGSAIFSRGGTQVLCSATVGPARMQKRIHPTLEKVRERRAMLQYDFPPYCVGRTGRAWGLNRRMVGHGNLAERGVLPILAPIFEDKNSYPFAIHIGSEVTASDGSSSMATVSGASLALMDAGVPISRPATGVSIGLFIDPDNTSEFCTPVDILGMEDHFGGMDFKLCGTTEGFTALQLDIKHPSISSNMIKMAFEASQEAHKHLISRMCKDSGLSGPRPTLKADHWVIRRMRISRDVLAGSDLDTIQEIEDSLNVYFEVDEDNRVLTVFAPNKNKIPGAWKLLQQKGLIL